MGKAKELVCPSCGHKNRVPLHKGCCGSCGTDVRDWPRARKHSSPDRLSLLWLMVAVVTTGVLTTATVVGLPMVVHALDFEGSAGMIVAIPVWFLCGALMGLISPSRAYAEPVLATTLVAVPTVVWLIRTQTVKLMPPFLYILLAALGVLFALIGAHTGQLLQAEAKPR